MGGIKFGDETKITNMVERDRAIAGKRERRAKEKRFFFIAKDIGGHKTEFASVSFVPSLSQEIFLSLFLSKLSKSVVVYLMTRRG